MKEWHKTALAAAGCFVGPLLMMLGAGTMAATDSENLDFVAGFFLTGGIIALMGGFGILGASVIYFVGDRL